MIAAAGSGAPAAPHGAEESTEEFAAEVAKIEDQGDREKVVSALKEFFVSEQLKPFFEDSYGFAIFPTIGKGGFVVGGAYGKGRVFEQGHYIGNTSMAQATIGFQLGGTGFSQVVFFEDQRAFAEFVSGSFEFEAEAQATVLTAAAGASASTGGSSAAASTMRGTPISLAMGITSESARLRSFSNSRK